MNLSRKGQWNGAKSSTVPSGRILLVAIIPARCAGLISGCPFGTKPRRRKPMVKKLERFVKFRPRTTLREIIRLTARLAVDNGENWRFVVVVFTASLRKGFPPLLHRHTLESKS